ncbi:MAG: alcohol dehydrogenase catalytic domain-containing protein, partial [Kofleriaceae bacterium]
MSHHEIAIEKFGAAHSLTYRERALVAPAPGEVAIDVKYSGVNFADVQMRLGFYPDAPKKPFVPGYEVSGVVADVGPGVTTVKRGDAVVAGTYFGGYASRVTIPATQVFPLPRNATLETGAALPVNYFTAQLALHDMARVRAPCRG